MSCRKLAEVDSLSATRGISSSPEAGPASRCILTPCPKGKSKPEAFHRLPSSCDRRRNTSFRRSWQSVILVADHANQRKRTGISAWLHLANYLALCPSLELGLFAPMRARSNGLGLAYQFAALQTRCAGLALPAIRNFLPPTRKNLHGLPGLTSTMARCRWRSASRCNTRKHHVVWISGSE